MKRLTCIVRSRSSFRASARPVDFHEKKLVSESSRAFLNWFRNRNSWRAGGYALSGAGFARMPRKILSPQGFRIQNPDFKELIGGELRQHSIVFASTMMGLFPIRHKVRCHIEAGTPVEISRRATRYWWYRSGFLGMSEVHGGREETGRGRSSSRLLARNRLPSTALWTQSWALHFHVALATFLCCNSNIEVPNERNPGRAFP